MNTDKIKRLILEATEDSNLRDKLRRDSRDVALLQAREYGSNVPITEKMLKYATRVGDTDKMAQASEAYRATRLAQALGDNDIKFIVDHADALNQQGKDALIQLLLERNDTANLYGLNKNLGNEFINKDLKNKFTRDQSKLLDEAVANDELQRKFYSKLDDDETAAELTGMSVDPKTDPARSRLIADRMRNGQTVDTSVDEMFNTARMPDEARDIDTISIDELGNHPRYKKWIADEERRLRGKVPSSPVRKEYIDPDFASKKRSLKGAVRASDIKDKTEILEEIINNRYGSVDNLRNTLKDVPEGAERIFDEEADLLNRYDDAMDEAGYTVGKPGKIPNDTLKRLDKEDALDREQLVRLAAEDPEKNKASINRLKVKMEQRDIERKNTPKEIDINPLSRDADELGDIDEDNVFNQFLDSDTKERIKPTPRSRDYGEESLMLRDNERANRFFRARESRGMKKEKDLPARTVNRIRGFKQTPDDRRKELTELASKSKNKYVSVHRGGKNHAYFITEKEALRDMYPRHTRIENDKIPAKSGEYKNPLDDIATEVFIKNVAKSKGRKPTATQIARLKNMSKEQVIDTYENLAHPSKYKVKNPKQTQLGKLMEDVRKLPEGKSAEEFDARVTKDGGKYWVELQDDVLPEEWDLQYPAFDTPDEVYRFLIKESFLGMNRPKMHR